MPSVSVASAASSLSLAGVCLAAQRGRWGARQAAQCQCAEHARNVCSGLAAPRTCLASTWPPTEHMFRLGQTVPQK